MVFIYFNNCSIIGKDFNNNGYVLYLDDPYVVDCIDESNNNSQIIYNNSLCENLDWTVQIYKLEDAEEITLLEEYLNQDLPFSDIVELMSLEYMGILGDDSETGEFNIFFDDSDTSTLSGSLLRMKNQLIYELGQKGVTASYSSSDGLLGLIGRIADIQTGGGGSCYHIEFTEDSYLAVNNVATVTVYLQENYAPKTSATVTFTGGSSTVTATTDSNGIATANVTVSSATTLTATYSNVSDTCTVNTIIYYINDDASSDNSSTLFGDSIALRNSGSNTIGWNSSGYYTIKTQSSGTKESFRVLSDLTGLTGDFCIEWDGYAEQSEGTDGIVIYNASDSWLKITDNIYQKEWWYGYNDGSFHEIKFYGNINTSQKWVHYKVTIQGSTMSVEATYEGDTVATDSRTIHFTRGATTKYGFNSEWATNKTTRYKNLVAYSI